MKPNAPVKPMSVYRLPIYNSSRLTDPEVIATFAARQLLLGRLIEDLSAEGPNTRAQHHLLVGQRGMGKTLLLARIAAELRTEPLSKRFTPLVFAEEQYAVDRLSKFWLNCLDSLADEQDREGKQAQVNRIDETVRRLNSRLASSDNDDILAQETLEAFIQLASETGRRPVLLVDNLQLVFERLSPEEQHQLREVLMRPGAPVLVGASPSPPPESQDYGAAFYDHFKIHYLRPLNLQEMQLVLLHLAEVMGDKNVRQRIQNNLNRLAVLRQLTGGNPRTTVTLFLLYAEDFSPTVFSDLENLLDRATPLYKAQFEELTPQQQVIASAVADHWDPITSRIIADNTGLAQNKISPQLDRMEKTGFLEKVELFGNSSTGYQLAERFFNIWFLMRSASRRQRRQVEFLTRFLQSFYESHERDRLARHLMAERNFSSDRYLLSCAVADSLQDRLVGEDLRRYAQLSILGEQNREARQRLEKILDLSALPPATLAFDQLRHKLIALVPGNLDISPQDFAEKILGDRQMFCNGTRERLAARLETLSGQEIAETLEILEQSRKVDVDEYGVQAVSWLSDRLINGQLRSSHDIEDWNRALQAAQTKESVQLMVDTLPVGLGEKILDETFNYIFELLHPVDDADARKWFKWGVTLQLRLQRYKEAEAAYREVLIREPQYAPAWNNLGNLFQNYLGGYEEAELAYREAIARDPQYAPAWDGLANLFQYRLKRYEEAESAYRESIACEPKSSYPWNGLGNLFQYRLKRYEEAKAAYREAIARDSKFARPWEGLGDLFQYSLERYEEAEAAYREAIAREPQSSYAWNHIGNLFQHRLKRYEEAESAYREAIAHSPQYVAAWDGLGNLFQYCFERYEDAEAAYREAIARDPKSASPWESLGNLFQYSLDRYEEAESAYRESITRDPNSHFVWDGLGNLLQDHSTRYEEAETAYIRELELDPDSEAAHQNLIFLRRDFLGDGVGAHALMERLIHLSNCKGLDLIAVHTSLFHAYEANWGLASKAFAEALEIIKGGFPANTTIGWLRASAVFLHLNYGTELLSFLQERGDDVRLRPWYEALNALQLGDLRYLQNVAPEIRITAEKFYVQIEHHLNGLPASTRRRQIPATPKRVKRRSKK